MNPGYILVFILAGLLLFFTPVGGFVNYILSGTLILLAIGFALAAIIELFDFSNLFTRSHIKKILFRLLVAFICIFLGVIINLVLPNDYRPSPAGDCIETRNRFC